MITIDGQPMEWVPGMTIAGLLETQEHTDFCAAVRLNGRIVSSPDFETTGVPDNAVLLLLPLIAGG